MNKEVSGGQPAREGGHRCGHLEQTAGDGRDSSPFLSGKTGEMTIRSGD